jgi:hypothetical protein
MVYRIWAVDPGAGRDARRDGEMRRENMGLSSSRGDLFQLK